MNKSVVTNLIYLLSGLLFLIAFFLWQGSVLRWVYLFCAIVFGSLGFVKMSRAQQK
jgi:hypothetical protein